MGDRAVRADAGLNGTARLVVAIVAMLAMPPLILVAAAHTNLLGGTTAYPIMFAAWLAGVAGIACSGWQLPARLIVGVAYTIVAILTLPFLTLAAVCTTGTCP